MKTKIQNVFNCIQNAKADALISISPINRKWLLGQSCADFALFLFYKKQVHVFVDARDFSTTKKIGNGIVCHLYNEVNDWLTFCKSLRLKNVLFESNHITVDDYNKFVRPLNLNAMAFDGDDIRIVKTPKEITSIKKSCHIICDAINHVKKWIKVGITEIQVANEILRFVKSKGASGLSFNTIIGFGSNSADIHGVPTNRKLKRDDLILIDAGCVYEGYCSDITRVFSLGKVNKKLWQIYDIVLNANKLAINKIKAGMTGIEVDKICRDYIKDKFNNYDFPHGTGHGIGMLIHENPRNNKIYNKPIPANSVVTIEPGIYIEGLGGVRIEDSVLVTKNGCEVLTKTVPK